MPSLPPFFILNLIDKVISRNDGLCLFSLDAIPKAIRKNTEHLPTPYPLPPGRGKQSKKKLSTAPPFAQNKLLIYNEHILKK
jgi:hypothetical protein